MDVLHLHKQRVLMPAASRDAGSRMSDRSSNKSKSESESELES